MTGNSVYQYSNPQKYLLDLLSLWQNEDSSFSVRKWARKMGLKSHTLLAMILRGQQPLRLKHTEFLFRGLPLDTQGQLYFQGLIQANRAKTIEEKKLCELWLSQLNPGKTIHSKEVAAFEMISSWLHHAILETTKLKGIKATEEAIHGKLKGRASIHEVRSAIQALLDLGLLKKDEVGVFHATHERVTTKDDVLNRGARAYHKKVSELARDSIDSIELDKREFQAFALTVPEEKIPLAKQMIRLFRAQFVKAMEAEPGDQVFQMNLQFFQVTDIPGGGLPS